MIDLNDTSQPLISLADACTILNCGKSAIYSYVKRGFAGQRLEVVKVGGRLKTTRKAIQEFLGVHETPIHTDDPHGLHQHGSQEEAWT